MIYTVALTKSGQITLPKALREFLGVEGAKTVRLEKHGNSVTIEREQNYDEFRAEMDRHLSKKTKRILAEEERNGGRPPIREVMKEIYASPATQKRWKEKLGE